jgi:hypothetical protein
MRIPPRARAEAGFSLPELLVAATLMVLVIGTVTTLLTHMAHTQRTVWNRTQMHSSVRGATELLQQEVGQAGLVSWPGNVTLGGAVAIGAATVGVTSVAGMFVGEQVIVDAGANQETVTITAVNAAANQITASFALAHANGAAVIAAGGFSSGIVPPAMVNGSTGNVLKLYGDVNSDGNMVYVEYTCDYAANRLYRNMMAWNAAAKPALTSTNVLLSNIVANPNGTPCFIYQTAVVGANTYVLDVAITLTVRTEQQDPVTKQFQTETKTLLNVSPRNVFNVWEMASIGETNRIQPMPPSILVLIQ